MLIGTLVPGVIAAYAVAGALLYSGKPWWLALIALTVTGSLTIMAVAIRNALGSDDDFDTPHRARQAIPAKAAIPD